jgi:hypothetical protein
VLLTIDGSVMVPRKGAVTSPPEAARGLRDLLRRLLATSSGTMPGLAAAARVREAERDVDGVVSDIEAALIPVNRAAAKRALARLSRETLRAKEAGKLKKKAPAAQPAAPAITATVKVPVAPPPAPAPPVAAPEPKVAVAPPPAPAVTAPEPKVAVAPPPEPVAAAPESKAVVLGSAPAPASPATTAEPVAASAAPPPSAALPIKEPELVVKVPEMVARELEIVARELSEKESARPGAVAPEPPPPAPAAIALEPAAELPPAPAAIALEPAAALPPAPAAIALAPAAELPPAPVSLATATPTPTPIEIDVELSATPIGSYVPADALLAWTDSDATIADPEAMAVIEAACGHPDVALETVDLEPAALARTAEPRVIISASAHLARTPAPAPARTPAPAIALAPAPAPSRNPLEFATPSELTAEAPQAAMFSTPETSRADELLHAFRAEDQGDRAVAAAASSLRAFAGVDEAPASRHTAGPRTAAPRSAPIERRPATTFDDLDDEILPLPPPRPKQAARSRWPLAIFALGVLVLFAAWLYRPTLAQDFFGLRRLVAPAPSPAAAPARSVDAAPQPEAPAAPVIPARSRESRAEGGSGEGARRRRD